MLNDLINEMGEKLKEIRVMSEYSHVGLPTQVNLCLFVVSSLCISSLVCGVLQSVYALNTTLLCAWTSAVDSGR